MQESRTGLIGWLAAFPLRLGLGRHARLTWGAAGLAGATFATTWAMASEWQSSKLATCLIGVAGVTLVTAMFAAFSQGRAHDMTVLGVAVMTALSLACWVPFSRPAMSADSSSGSASFLHIPATKCSSTPAPAGGIAALSCTGSTGSFKSFYGSRFGSSAKARADYQKHAAALRARHDRWYRYKDGRGLYVMTVYRTQHSIHFRLMLGRISARGVYRGRSLDALDRAIERLRDKHAFGKYPV